VQDDSMLSAFIVRLEAHAAFICIAGGLVFVAYLINRFAPQERRHIRRVVILFGLYLFTVVLSSAVHVAGPTQLWHAAHFAAELLEAFTAVNLVTLAIFDVLLPAIKMQAAPIAADLMVGLAYLASTIFVLIEEGFNPASVLGASAVASAVLVVSLQSTLGNILGGIAIQARRIDPRRATGSSSRTDVRAR
jgi:small-conductance mechanosensitive channel